MRPGAEAHDRDIPLISAKPANVALHPLEQRPLVHQPQIRDDFPGSNTTREEPQRPKTIIEAHGNHIALRKRNKRREVPFPSPSEVEGPAMRYIRLLSVHTYVVLQTAAPQPSAGKGEPIDVLYTKTGTFFPSTTAPAGRNTLAFKHPPSSAGYVGSAVGHTGPYSAASNESPEWPGSSGRRRRWHFAYGTPRNASTSRGNSGSESVVPTKSP
ncbi:hypothetical protein CCUS01_15475 [Colletotrichum cuscutae]|uniref:Uncharacterized protein n=1 Tax=Colletotrichum cuscutae TaxID=1209917 RepID=A0AAI9Y4H0_9PEZI|nr:hypothetical protein CCUS01_15475 [Colletotrichum cuscutae]